VDAEDDVADGEAGSGEMERAADIEVEAAVAVLAMVVEAEALAAMLAGDEVRAVELVAFAEAEAHANDAAAIVKKLPLLQTWTSHFLR
jgi:hypothetical protein